MSKLTKGSKVSPQARLPALNIGISPAKSKSDSPGSTNNMLGSSGATITTTVESLETETENGANNQRKDKITNLDML